MDRTLPPRPQAAAPAPPRLPAAARAGITTQRAGLGRPLGQVRDVEAAWTKEAIARVTTETPTLKQRARQPTPDNRPREERLQAARPNNRVADRRIAQLEAEL